MCYIFFFKQKSAYEMRISDGSSDVCSSDLLGAVPVERLDMITFARGIQPGLPVRFNNAGKPRAVAKRIERRFVQHVDYAPQKLAQRLTGVRIQIDENQPFPDLTGNRHKAGLSNIDIWKGLPVGNSAQLSIGVV